MGLAGEAEIAGETCRMETIYTVEWMKQVTRQARAEGHLVGLVPTMGALHQGHLSLVRAAQQQCKPVVVSIFVNPQQFGPNEDFSKYPRRLEADSALLEGLRVEYLLAPPPAEIYPDGFRTYVNVEGVSERLEGRSPLPRSRRCENRRDRFPPGAGQTGTRRAGLRAARYRPPAGAGTWRNLRSGQTAAG